MRKHLTLLCFIFCSGISAFSNSTDSLLVEKKKVEFSGFFRADYWYDSRQVVDAVDGLFLLYPKRPELDANGNDIQAAPNINSLAMATRLRANISMPNLFNAKSIIFIEGDFTGMSNAVNVRLRHAYTKLQWAKSSLLFGLTWHPMFVTDVFPTVAGLNTGAPFQSFNRSPQLSFQQKLTPKLTLSLSIINQSDSRSLGPNPTPNEASSTYIRNGLLPNLNGGLQFVNGTLTVGGSIDFKSLRPRLFTTSLKTPSLKYVTKERVNSFSGMIYMKYQTSILAIKFKGILGQNLYEHLLLGGYAVSSLDSTTGKETYTPTNHLFLFSNITYGKKYQFNLFLGYAKNLGTIRNFVSSTDRIYGRGMDIDYMYRVSPSVSYIYDRFQLTGELEYTASSFGDIANMHRGKIINSKLTSNYRVLMVVQYSF